MKLDAKKIGAQIRAKRGRRPQEEIEKITGVSQTSIGRIELGQFKEISSGVVALARYFHVALPGISLDEHIDSADVAMSVSGKAPAVPNSPGIPELEGRAGMGGGAIPSIELQGAGNAVDPVKPDLWFLPQGFIKDELRAMPRGLVILETQGDSMAPTLLPGERVFVDTNHKRPSPDGIYALRDQFGGLIVKRIHALAKKGHFSIISDNPAHPPKDVRVQDLDGEIVGRIVGAIKRL